MFDQVCDAIGYGSRLTSSGPRNNQRGLRLCRHDAKLFVVQLRSVTCEFFRKCGLISLKNIAGHVSFIARYAIRRKGYSGLPAAEQVDEVGQEHDVLPDHVDRRQGSRLVIEQMIAFAKNAEVRVLFKEIKYGTGK